VDTLPRQLTSFIGRRRECAAVVELLAANPLVTLTGAGGCGKTRMSLKIAENLAGDHPDGVWWIDLAKLSDDTLLLNTVASALSIKEVPGHSLLETLKTHLRDQRALVLLDNCEHVLGACAGVVHELLHACPSLSILATSREPLGITGEVSWVVPPLDLPEDEDPPVLESLLHSSAVRLFVDRAARVRPAFKLTQENARAVAKICHRLDGMPLAIELAAARARMMTPEQILAGLDDRFHLLTGGTRTGSTRHQTLRASVDWSYDLLTEEERGTLRRLAVFAGGFTLEAAEAVCSWDGVACDAVLDIVARLVDRSLVQVGEETPAARYRLLETIRQYAYAKLVDAGEEHGARMRHLGFFVDLAERAQPEMETSGLVKWVSVFDDELDNLRAAFDWSVQSDAPEECLRLMASLWMFWMIRGHLTEGRRRYELALGGARTDPRLRATALVGAGQLMAYFGDPVANEAFATEALEIARTLGDEGLEGRALDTLGYSAAFLDPQVATELFQEAAALLERKGDDVFLADALNGIGIARYFVGDYAGARTALEKGVECARRADNENMLTISLGILGFTLGLQGDLNRAQGCLNEALQHARRLNDPVWTAQALYGLGFVEAHRGGYARAEVQLDESVRIGRAVSPMILAFALLVQGHARYMQGEFDGAVSALEEAHSLSQNLVVHWLRSWSLAVLGNVLRLKGDLDGARARIDEAITVARSGGVRIDIVIDANARLARAEDEAARSESLHHEVLSAARDAESVLLVPAQLEALGGLAVQAEGFSEAARLFGAAEVAREAYDLPRSAVERDAYKADIGRVRRALPEPEVREAWEQGRAMSLAEAAAYASRGRGERKRPSSGWASLTPTELEVVRHVATGLTNPQIAERLFVSRSTVKGHIAHIFSKLGMSTRAELAAAASRRQP
jgi:predicted ATPase/DNA-binding CsgD family transcriptional regulator